MCKILRIIIIIPLDSGKCFISYEIIYATSVAPIYQIPDSKVLVILFKPFVAVALHLTMSKYSLVIVEKLLQYLIIMIISDHYLLEPDIVLNTLHY